MSNILLLKRRMSEIRLLVFKAWPDSQSKYRKIWRDISRSLAHGRNPSIMATAHALTKLTTIEYEARVTVKESKNVRSKTTSKKKTN